MFCTHCGSSALDGSQFCGRCGKSMTGSVVDFASTPSRIAAGLLPPTLANSLTSIQRNCLAFATLDMNVKSATIQSYNLGSHGTGHLRITGLGRAIGPWGIFGATGSINQQTINTFRTDIQVKLQDAAGHGTFLNYSLPFALTLAIEPGERLRVFYVKGGLPNPSEQDDFVVVRWTPFAAQNLNTGQIVPIMGLPILSLPNINSLLVPGIVICSIGLMFFGVAIVGGDDAIAPSLVFGILLVLISGGLISGGLVKKKRSEQALRKAAIVAQN